MSRTKVSLIAIVVMICATIGYIAARGHLIDNPRKDVETIALYPEPEYARIMFMGFDAMASNFLLTKAQYYFGSHYITDKTYPFIEQMIKVIVTLNPDLKIALLFGDSVLTSMGIPEAVEGAGRLLDLGHELYPEDYEFVFRKGYNYYLYLQDMERAYPLMYKGARMKGAPENLYWLVSKVATRGGGYQLGYEYTKSLYEAAKDKNMKKHYGSRLKLFGDLLLLSKLVEKFMAEKGREPDKQLSELVKSGYIRAVPTEPYGGKYYYDAGDQKVKTDSDLYSKK